MGKCYSSLDNSTERRDYPRINAQQLTNFSPHQQSQPRAERKERTNHNKEKHRQRDHNTDDLTRNRHGERTAPDRTQNVYDIYYNGLKGKKKKSHAMCWQEISSLRESISARDSVVEELQKDMNQKKDALSQQQKEVDNLKRDNSSLESRITTDKRQLERLQTDQRQMKDAISQRDQDIHNLRNKMSTLELRLKELQDDKKTFEHGILLQQQQIQNLETEKSVLLTRLSAIASAKLTDGNANIADLSDENRPTKLAEQFSELYDNEWTDAFAYLTKDKNDDEHLYHNMKVFTPRQNRTEKDACSFLLRNFIDIYSYCKKAAKEETEQLNLSLQDFNGGQPPPRELSKQVKDMRKKNYGNCSVTTIKLVLDRALPNTYDIESWEMKSFLERCVLLCRRMVVQDPPVFIDTSFKLKGETFNSSLFKPYTKSGPFIDFVVWPTLYLCEGGNILSKGVAQATITSVKEIQEIDLAVNETPRASPKQVQDAEERKFSMFSSKPPKADGETEKKGASKTTTDTRSSGQQTHVNVEKRTEITSPHCKDMAPNALSQKSQLKAQNKRQSVYDQSDQNVTEHPELGIIHSPTNSPVTSAHMKEEDPAQFGKISVTERVKELDKKKQTDKGLLNAPPKPQQRDEDFKRKNTDDEGVTEIRNIKSTMPVTAQFQHSLQTKTSYTSSISGTTKINVSSKNKN